MTALQAHPAQTCALPPRSAVASALTVRTRELCYAVNDRLILSRINLDLPTGSFLCVLGANGAGKSTFIHLLGTLLTPTAGELQLFGRPMQRQHAVALRARIGMIGHQPMLYRHLSARQNLSLFGRLYGLAQPDERTDDLLNQVALYDRADDTVAGFSRGMTQRLAIARALMHNPDLLLADEPFAGLDVISTRTLERLLHRLHEAGKTIVLTHHDIHQSLRLSQRVIVLRKGLLVADSPSKQTDPDTLFNEVTG